MAKKLRYENLLSPIQVGSHLIKNRLMAALSLPYNTESSDGYVTDAVIQHYGNKAKTGTGLIVVGGNLRLPSAPYHPMPNEEILKLRKVFPNTFNPDHGWHITSGRTEGLDIVNGGCQNRMSELSEIMHFYGTKCVMSCPHLEMIFPGYDVSAGNSPIDVYGSAPPNFFEIVTKGEKSKELTKEMLMQILDELELTCSLLKECGFDGVYLHMNYRMMLLGKFLSPLTNRRTDEFGGSNENRARFPIMAMDRIKQRCGKDFLIVASISARDMPGGFSFEDNLEYARLFKDHLDILQIKSGLTIDEAHTMGFIKSHVPGLSDGAAFKRAVPGLPIAINGGFVYLEDCEAAVADGQTDFVATARGFISNPDFGTLAYEGRGEDLRPCLRCNACHVTSYHRPWISACSVNPVWGFEHRIERMVPPVGEKKKVAVIGGGPAGMQAALTAIERGHDVTLYEKAPVLGGLLNLLDNISFKWPHKDFKNYLIRQIEKSPVKVALNTDATLELLGKEDYDAILVAIGAETLIPKIPGVDGKNVVTALESLEDESRVKGDVVIVGGGDVGTETGVHFVEKGHNVTVLEMASMLADKAPPIHSYNNLREYWMSLSNFTGITNAFVTEIGPDYVAYTDKEGNAQKVRADTVLISVGMKPKHTEAMRFAEAGGKFVIIGNCDATGDIQRAIRSAYGVAVTL